MYSALLTVALTLLFLAPVRAGIFVVEPLQGSTCSASQPCTITWLDNGVRPLLSAIGVCKVGLYTGKQQLVQTIAPVDVSQTQSVTFIPNPAAGPNSDTYYIAITSTTLKGNDSIPYSGWSSYFTLTGMSGSFDAPLPSATAPIAIPSTLTHLTSGSIATSTRVISAPISTSSGSSSSRLSTVFKSTTSTASSSSPSASSSSKPTSSASSSSKSTTSTSTVSTPTSTSASVTTPTTALSIATSAAAAANNAATSSAGGASRLSASVLMFTLASSLLFSAFS